MRHYKNSLKLYHATREKLPCGGQTLSKAPERFPLGAYPILLEAGNGSRVWDADGNEYVDYVCGLGPVILGYGHPAVSAAIRRQLMTGLITTSLETPLVGEVAEIICDMVPCAEAVRFVKTGSDACSAAVRLARTYTGRNIILTDGYHGWDDMFQCQAADERGRRGIPATPTTVSIQYNNLDDLARALELYDARIAAVILEPARTFEPAPGYLQGVKDLCHLHGTLLIFDEVVTSFRWAKGGAQEYYKVIPDIACLGKAMANGMPLGAVVGQRDVMSAFERCFVSGTYGGEALSLAAAKATLTTIQEEPVIEHLWDHGRAMRALLRRWPLQKADGANIMRLEGLPCCSVQIFDSGNTEVDVFLKSLWLQETAKHGVLFGNIQYTGLQHTEADLSRVAQAVEAAAEVIAAAVDDEDPQHFLDGAVIGADALQPPPRTDCQHPHAVEITAMGDSNHQYLCPDCGCTYHGGPMR